MTDLLAGRKRRSRPEQEEELPISSSGGGEEASSTVDLKKDKGTLLPRKDQDIEEGKAVKAKKMSRPQSRLVPSSSDEKGGYELFVRGSRDRRFRAGLVNANVFLSNFWPNVQVMEATTRKPSKDKSAALKALHTARLIQLDTETASMAPSIPCSDMFEADGHRFHSSEHYYQWRLFNDFDPGYASLILASPDASTAKSLSGKTSYVAKKKDMDSSVTKAELGRRYDGWKAKIHKEGKHLDIMREALRLKFSNPWLQQALKATYPDRLVEDAGRHFDVHKGPYWSEVKKTGSGHNMLGQLLMELRYHLLFRDQKMTEGATDVTMKRPISPSSSSSSSVSLSSSLSSLSSSASPKTK